MCTDITPETGKTCADYYTTPTQFDDLGFRCGSAGNGQCVTTGPQCNASAPPSAPPPVQFIDATTCKTPTTEGRSVGGAPGLVGRCGSPIDCGGGGCASGGWSATYPKPSADYLYEQTKPDGSSVQCVKVTYNHWVKDQPASDNLCAAAFNEGENTDVTPENCAKICQMTPGCRGFSMLYGKNFLSNGRCSFCTFTGDDPATSGSAHGGYDAWDVMGTGGGGCKVM